jgi:predicted glycosyltransferase
MDMGRVALYSHDAQGLGHVRRSLAIAGALGSLRPRPDVLVLCGADEAAGLPRPEHCDLLGLPGLTKLGPGRYAPRHLGMALPELRALRAGVLAAALDAFAPDLLVVDRHPRGIDGELEPALDVLAGRTRVVLGLRDVLDEPDAAAAQWRRDRSAHALAKWYDAVWVYGDPRVYDATAALDLPPLLARRVFFTGYLANGRDLPARAGTSLPTRYVLAMVGGGSDGGQLARAFAAARLPAGLPGVLVLGPHMPPGDKVAVRAAAAERADLHVLDFVEDMTAVLDGAVAAVSMGGYNSVCELLARGTPTLVVPRVAPREEQLVRARRLADLGVLDVLTPDRLDPERLAAWVDRAVAGGRERPADGPDLDGLARVRTLTQRMLGRQEVSDVAV